MGYFNNQVQENVLPTLTDDIFFTDDTHYIGYDSDNTTNGRPVEIRFTKKLVSDYAHAHGVTETEANAVVLRNSSIASSGNQQMAPPIYQSGQGWKTDATAATKDCTWRMGVLPVQGAAAPTATRQWSVSIAGGAYSTPMTLTSAGTLAISTLYSDIMRDASANFLIRLADYSTGLGTTVNYGCFVDNPIILLNTATGRDTANGVVAATAFDRNAASITNKDTVRLHDFGWTNNSNAWQSEFAVIANGSVLFGTAQTVGAAPTAIAVGQLAYFSNGAAGNPVMAFWDGSNWARCDTLAAIAAS